MHVLEQLATSLAASGWEAEMTHDDRLLVGDAWSNLSVSVQNDNFVIRQGWRYVADLPAMSSLDDVMSLLSSH